MAEILIKAVDATNPNPETDKGCYKRGMPVVVMPDGHKWGSEEGPPKFFVLKLPGVPVEQVQALINEEREEYFDEETSQIRARMIRRREWKVFVDELPPVVRGRLLATGKLTIDCTGTMPAKDKDADWNVVRNYVKKVSTNEVAPASVAELSSPSLPPEAD